MFQSGSIGLNSYYVSKASEKTWEGTRAKVLKGEALRPRTHECMAG